MQEEDVLSMQNEIDILRALDHTNIVKLVDFYEDPGHYCLIMELMRGGELFDYIIEQEQFSEKLAHRIMAPLFDAVIYCHSHQIVHRDIKPENLLLDDKDIGDAQVKIADFGLARYVNPEAEQLATTQCGTPGYVAPEIISNRAYGQQCDYWSLAVVLFIMLSGTPPFYHEDNFELFEMIKKGDYDKDFTGNGWADVSPEAKDFISQLLVVDPDQRMTSDAIQSHPWFLGNFTAGKEINVLEKMK